MSSSSSHPSRTLRHHRGALIALGLACSLLFPSVAEASEPGPTWVFFVDRGRTNAELEADLEVRRVELGSRTLTRRSKVRDGPLVDAKDLAPASRYIAAIEGTGAKVRVRSRWLNAISIEADPASLRAIAALPFVSELRPIARAERVTPHFPPQSTAATANRDDYGYSWEQLDLLGVPPLHDCGLSGAGVLIGVQDSGFELSHEAFAEVEVVATYDFIDDDDNVGIEAGDEPEQHAHGTAVLSTIVASEPGVYRGVAHGASVLLAKTEDSYVEEPYEEDYYVAGLEWIEGMGADIFTASLGYSAWYVPDDYDGQTAVTTVAVEAAVANGLIVLTSMGNNGPEPSTLIAPADSEGAISVGAVDYDAVIADFSSRGPTADGRLKPDVVAPGVDVWVVHPLTTDNYLPREGTSYATPLTAGVAALLLEANPGLTPAEMAELLRTTATQAGAPDNDYGYGLVDALAAGPWECACPDLDDDGFHESSCGGMDCDDDNASSYPGAEEVCNGLDDDCDGALLAGEFDVDGDGYFACSDDCDDDNAMVNPGVDELCGNDVDDDCDGAVDEPDDCEDPSGETEAGADDEAGVETGDAGTESEDDGAGANDVGEEGCACALEGQQGKRGRGGPLVGLGLFALLGLTRLRRRNLARV